MRTAVVRVDVDPTGALAPEELSAGMAALAEQAAAVGAELIQTALAAMPVGRRQVHLLIAGIDADSVEQVGIRLCAGVFGTEPVAGVTTYVSRGTDDDVRGVLSGFGLTGDIRRSPGADGLDVVYVTVGEADLQRAGESRLHTALEASLNCEVHIRAG